MRLPSQVPATPSYALQQLGSVLWGVSKYSVGNRSALIIHSDCPITRSQHNEVLLLQGPQISSNGRMALLKRPKDEHFPVMQKM
jgi:hypothetical protein